MEITGIRLLEKLNKALDQIQFVQKRLDKGTSRKPVEFIDWTLPAYRATPTPRLHRQVSLLGEEAYATMKLDPGIPFGALPRISPPAGHPMTYPDLKHADR